MGDFDCSKPADGTPLLTCCEGSPPPGDVVLVKYRAVQVQANCKLVISGQGNSTPFGWYPRGANFTEELAVMKTVMDRCVQVCNSLPFPDSYISAPFTTPIPTSLRYNLVHPNPIYGVPGRFISSGTELISEISATQPGLATINRAGIAFVECGFSEWNRPTLYEWTMAATKTELTFNKQTKSCIRLHICTIDNYGLGSTQGISLVHTVLAPDYDIISLRNTNTCRGTIGYKVLTFVPGACPT